MFLGVTQPQGRTAPIFWGTQLDPGICPSLIEIGSKTAVKNSAQTNKQTDRHYENNGHLAVNQNLSR